MDTYSLLALFTFLLSLIALAFLAKLFRDLIRKQIDDRIKQIIPIKAIRERIGVRIKLRK